MVQGVVVHAAEPRSAAAREPGGAPIRSRRMADSPVRMRPEIAALPAYKQGRQAVADGYKLSSNENPFGPLVEIVEAVAPRGGEPVPRRDRARRCARSSASGSG